MKSSRVKTLLSDLETVKKAVRRSRNVLQEIRFPRPMRLTFLLFGVAVVGFCAVLAWLLGRYGSYGLLPFRIKSAFWIAAGLCLLGIGFLKQSSLWAAFRELRPGSAFGAMYAEFFRFAGFVHFYLTFLLGIAFLVPYLLLTGHAILLIPVVAVTAGFAVNVFASSFGLTNLLVLGYWFVLSGFGSLLLLPAHPLAGLCATFGAGGIVYGVYGYLPAGPGDCG